MKKLFTSDTFFAFSTWFAAVCSIPCAVVFIASYNEKLLWLASIMRIILGVCLIVTYFAYKKHSKNVMKGMMGAILLGIVVIVLCSVLLYPDDLVFTLITLVLTVALFISHFLINSDHHSSPSSVLFNQCLSILFAVLSCVEGIMLIPSCVNVADTIIQVLACIAQPCTLFSIICIESRLDAYRKDREAAGWTEEVGYPEGYVHEYQKNK